MIWETKVISFIILVFMVMESILAANYTLGMDSETSCSKTHYYQAGDNFRVFVKGKVYNGFCPLTFIQETWSRGYYLEPCVSLCVKIVTYTLDSCQVRMSYQDGLTDYDPVLFDCHTYPPVMWCSSKNELKVTVSETKGYDNKEYSITLEIQPFCGSLSDHTTDSGVVVQPQVKNSAINHTALIIGAVVGTASILFVMGWLMYCYRHRDEGTPLQQSSTSIPVTQTDRCIRGTTPNQQSNRYAPIKDSYQNSSQSDRQTPLPYQSNSAINRNMANITSPERRPFSPFQPPPPSQRSAFTDTQPQQVMYSEFDRGGEKWYPAGIIDPASQQKMGVPGGGVVMTNKNPENQPSQYMTQNQIYKYPQDGEMHTVPADTRFVVYDFDFDRSERKYSGGRLQRESPHKDRPREITPLREMTAKLKPMGVPTQGDTTTTDHTTDNDSSFSTTEDETTTDDQMPVVRYNYNTPLGFFNQHGLRQPDSSSKVYDPRNFERSPTNLPPVTDRQVPCPQAKPGESISAMESSVPLTVANMNYVPVGESSVNKVTEREITDGLNADGETGESRLTETSEATNQTVPKLSESAKEGPMPQVPSLPKDIQRAACVSPPAQELPWPHGPPPPYNNDKFVI